MSRSTLLKYSFLLIGSIVLATGAAAAGSIDLSVSQDDELVWINEDADVNERTFSADLTCEGDYDNPEIKIREGSEVIANVSSGSISFSGFEDTGEYTASGECLDQNNKTHFDNVTFNVARINPEIEQPTFDQNAYRGKFLGENSLGRLYKGEPVKVNLKLEGVPSDFSIEKSEISFDTRLSGYDSSGGLANNFKWDKDDARADLRVYIPEGVPGGYHALKIDTIYDGEDASFFTSSSTRDNAVYVTGIRIDQLRPDRQLLRENVGDIGLDLSVESSYRKYMSEDRFLLEVKSSGDDGFGGEEDTYEDMFNVAQNQDNPGKYRLRLETVPELPESDDFQVKVLFDDPEKLSDKGKPVEIASYDVTEDVIFSGYVRDSENQPVNTKFRISSGDKYVQFSNLDNGFYSKRLDPGNKSAIMEFFQGGGMKTRLDLRNVEVKQRYNSKVSYQYTSDPGNIGIPGADPVNMMSVAFGMPFQEEGSTASMKYDSAGINFEKTSVYECDNWDFQGRECRSNWDQIPNEDVTPNPVEYRLKFPVTPLETQYFNTEKKILRSAYVVATTSGLRLNGEPQVQGTQNGRIESGGEIKFNGMVVAGGGSQVSDAEVDVSITDGSQEVVSFSDTTDSDGAFTASGKVPEAPGNYSVKISASKGSYDGFDSELSDELWVYQKEGMSLATEASQPEVSLVEETRVEFEVENTGQTSIENVELNAESSDLAPDFFRLSKENIESISAGDSETVEIVFDFPDSYSPDSYYPELDVTATADGEKGDVESEMTLRPVLTRADSGSDNDQKQSDQKNSSATGSFFSAPSMSVSDVPGAEATGQFLASQSTLNIALGLIMIFMMVLAGAMKKQKSSGSGARRNVMPQNQGRAARSGRPGVQPPKVTPAHEENGKPVEDEVEEAEDSTGEEDEKDDETAEPGDDEESVEAEDSEPGKTEDDQEDSDEDGEVDKMAEAMSEPGDDMESEEDSSGSSSVKCDVCGEEFDTEAGVKLHKETSH